MDRGHPSTRRRSPPAPCIPSVAPEHFAVCTAQDTGKAKQFRRGIDQLEQEGVVQIFRSELRGDAAPILAAVGPLQFEVAAHRLAHEFNSPARLERLPYAIARLSRAADEAVLRAERDVEPARLPDGTVIALITDRWRLQSLRRAHPDLMLEPFVAQADI